MVRSGCICFDCRVMLASIALASTAIIGCSEKHAASVSGTVTLGGQPLTTGSVSFYPDGGSGAPAYGQIDSQGHYTLSTGTDAGLAPGKYVAVVVATEEVQPAAGPTAVEVPPKLLTPAKYGNVATSELRVEVKPGANSIPLDLKSS